MTSGGRLTRAAGWILLAVCVASIVLSGVLYDLNPRKPGDEPTLVGMIWLASFAGFPVVGAIIVAKLPRNPIGWILGGIGAAIGLMSLVNEYATYALVVRDGDIPGGHIAAWLSMWAATVPAVLVILLLINFPRGAPRNTRWHAVSRGVMGAGVALALMYAFRPGPLDGTRQIHNPLGVRAVGGFVDLAIPMTANLLALLFLAAVLDKVVMFRKATGDERQQIKWFAVPALLFPALFAGSIFWEEAFGRNRWGELDPVVIAFFLGFNGMAAGIGVAVFKYRLYDVGVVVNRTLVYGGLSAALALTYAGAVFGLQAVLPNAAADSNVAVAASTLAVAALFRPLRSRIQTFIDHRFYRRKFDIEQTIEQFGRDLRDEVDLADLSRHLTKVVGDTMQPAHVSLWLRSTA